MAPRPGLSASVSMQVTNDDTACAFHSGDVEVLATPRVVALAEEASIKAITTVGYRVQFDHLAPVAPGGTVQAEATLEAVEGKRLTFRVSVTDTHGGLVAAGRITRVSVERARFLEKATGS